MGYIVTLADLPLDWFKFAEWRSKKYNTPDLDYIFIEHPYKYLPDGRMWDFIWSHHALEHCLHPHKALAHLSNHLNISGLAYLQPAFTGHKYHLCHNRDLFGIEDDGTTNTNGNSKWRKCLNDAGLEKYKYKNCVDMYIKVRPVKWGEFDFE